MCILSDSLALFFVTLKIHTGQLKLVVGLFLFYMVVRCGVRLCLVIFPGMVPRGPGLPCLCLRVLPWLVFR